MRIIENPTIIVSLATIQTKSMFIEKKDMELANKSAVIFTLIVALIGLAGVFPSSGSIAFAIFVGSALIIYQVIIILKDDSDENYEAETLYRDRPDIQ